MNLRAVRRSSLVVVCIRMFCNKSWKIVAHREGVLCSSTNLSRHIKAVVGKNGIFFRLKQKGSNTQRESTEKILLGIAAGGSAAVVLQVEGQNNSSHL